MEEKEAQVQQAIGTRQRQVFIHTDWKNADNLFGGFVKACKNFGLFLYNNPVYKGSNSYGFVMPDQELTDEQLEKICAINKA